MTGERVGSVGAGRVSQGSGVGVGEVGLDSEVGLIVGLEIG